jgi:allene oxide cyclase-like protein
MKRKLFLRMALSSTAVAVAIGAVGAGGAAGAAGDRIIRIDSVVTQANFVDVSPEGPSLGDELVVHDDWKDLNGQVVGHDGITCTVTSLDPNGDTEFLCLLTGHLEQGDLSAQGLFTEPPTEPPPARAVLGVTGGTGIYANAAGSLVFQEVSEEESHLTFHLQAS